MTPKQRRSLPQHPIFKESIEQFGRELSEFFPSEQFKGRESIPSFLVKHDEDLKDIKRDLNTDQFSIPLFTYSLDTLSPNKERFNNGFLARHGIPLQNKPSKDAILDNPWLSYDTLFLKPALLNINVSFYCAYADQYVFAPMWQQAAEYNYLNFEMDVGDTVIPFKVEINEDLTFSPLELDENDFLRVSTSVVLHTFHGTIGKTKAATSTRVNTGIVAHGKEQNKQVQPSMTITREKSKIFTIKNNIDGDTIRDKGE